VAAIAPPVEASRAPATLVPAPLASTELVDIAAGLVAEARRWPAGRRAAGRTWELMVVSGGFEAWMIAWPPGGAIVLHDHGNSAGAVVVATGELTETAIAELPGGGVDSHSTALPEGSSISFGPGHIHDIVNLGTATAISVHVYAPRLSAMTFYEILGGGLFRRHTVEYELGEAHR
jgi:hypothetical protein